MNALDGPFELARFRISMFCEKANILFLLHETIEKENDVKSFINLLFENANEEEAKLLPDALKDLKNANTLICDLANVMEHIYNISA